MTTVNYILQGNVVIKSPGRNHHEKRWATLTAKRLAIFKAETNLVALHTIPLLSLKEVMLDQKTHDVVLLSEGSMYSFHAKQANETTQWLDEIQKTWQKAIDESSIEFAKHEEAVIIIQRFWRAYQVRKNEGAVLHEHLRRFRAARTIQRAYRSYNRRKVTGASGTTMSGKRMTLAEIVEFQANHIPMDIIDYVIVFRTTSRKIEHENQQKEKKDQQQHQEMELKPAPTFERDPYPFATRRPQFETKSSKKKKGRKKVERVKQNAKEKDQPKYDDEDDVGLTCFGKPDRTMREIKKVQNLIVSKLKAKNLGVDLRGSSDGKLTFLRISASFEALCAEAERFKLRKILKPEAVTVEGCDVVEFTVSQRNDFDGIDHPTTFFFPAERKRLVWRLLTSIEVNSDEKFGSLRYGDNLIPRAIATGYAESIFPMQNIKPMNALKDEWKKLSLNPPVPSIASYFGEKIAVQFLFSGFYAKWLIFIAIMGLIGFIIGMINPGGTGRAVEASVLAIIMLVWVSLFDKSWARKQNIRKIDSGSITQREPQFVRPLFKGKVQFDPSTGKNERFYPRRMRFWRQVLSWFITLLFICVSVGAQFCTVFFERDIALAVSGNPSSGTPTFFGSLLPAMLAGILSMVLWTIYGRVAQTLTAFENFRTANQHETHYAIKMVVFLLFNNFFSIFQIIFGNNPFLMDDATESALCTRVDIRITVLLIFQFIKRQVGHNILPNIIGTLKEKKRKRQNAGYEKVKAELKAIEKDVERRKRGEDKRDKLAQEKANREAEEDEEDSAAKEQKADESSDLDDEEDDEAYIARKMAQLEQEKQEQARKQEEAKKEAEEEEFVAVVPRALMKALQDKKEEFAAVSESHRKQKNEYEIEMNKGRYDHLNQYLDMFNYLVFIVFFSCVTSLSALVSLISTLLDTLSARYKLLHLKQRPIPTQHPNTGWLRGSLSLISWLGIVINVGILFFVFKTDLTNLVLSISKQTMSKNELNAIQIIVLIVIENVALLIKALPSIFIPDIPKKTRDAIRKDERMHEDVIAQYKERERIERDKAFCEQAIKEYKRREEEKKKERIKQMQRDLEKRKRV
ncbi:putative Transmembrane protein 16H [Blattamonas nauphoetae]|uniref:Transmembrane protein 16H n=1 Tax=Blattamonas nauphoetae TaxID=2049346 RepID=A0ABQ9XJB9_9EUKA|nr:putative Transmembrane protein 16H [Blattamonas nauphoetae]